jgi:cell division protein FtsB
VKNYREISHLKAEIEAYDESYREDSIKLSNLFTDPEAIEKIARERYFMKADNEDIFVLSDDEMKEEPGL